jgi:hypothetical protein
MDASDVIRKLQTQRTYVESKLRTSLIQPTVDFSTCGALSSTSVKANYPTYDYFNQAKQGAKYCIGAPDTPSNN